VNRNFNVVSIGLFCIYSLHVPSRWWSHGFFVLHRNIQLADLLFSQVDVHVYLNVMYQSYSLDVM